MSVNDHQSQGLLTRIPIQQIPRLLLLAAPVVVVATAVAALVPSDRWCAVLLAAVFVINGMWWARLWETGRLLNQKNGDD